RKVTFGRMTSAAMRQSEAPPPSAATLRMRPSDIRTQPVLPSSPVKTLDRQGCLSVEPGRFATRKWSRSLNFEPLNQINENQINEYENQNTQSRHHHPNARHSRGAGKRHQGPNRIRQLGCDQQ